MRVRKEKYYFNFLILSREEIMKIKIEDKEGVSVVFIDGNVLQENVPIFRVKLLELIEANKLRIVLDMISCNYISSMCLAAIVDVKRKVSEKGRSHKNGSSQ